MPGGCRPTPFAADGGITRSPAIVSSELGFVTFWDRTNLHLGSRTSGRDRRVAERVVRRRYFECAQCGQCADTSGERHRPRRANLAQLGTQRAPLADFSPQARQARNLLAVFRGSQVVVETAPPGDPITAASRRKVKEYFQSQGPDWVQRILIFGVPALLLLGIATYLGLPLVIVRWLAMLASVVFLITAVIEERAKKREGLVDIVAACDFDRAQRLALARSQLTAADLRDPKCCAFFCSRAESSDEYGGAFVGRKLGKDERTRWTPHEVACVYVGHEQLYIHHCAIDLTTGAALYERTRQVFYVDIVSVVIDGKLHTFPMPPRHNKRVKASLYWGARGGVVLEDSLQFDGKQQVSLALTSGESLILATWEGSRDKGQPEDAVQSRASALRLRGWVEQGKRKASSIAPAPSPRITSNAKQPRHQA